MPAKKQIQLQETIETQDQWKAFISKDGLAVCDVYSAWCGPCKAVVSLFRRLKNELGDDLLQFATAKSDAIDDLENYRNHSEPCFLMYSAGVLVGIVRGAQGPLLEKTLKERLEHEHKVLNGEAERVSVVDEALGIEVVIPPDEDEKEEMEEEPEKEPVKKQVTVLVIKPDAVQAGKVEEIIGKLTEKGYEILTQEERQLTKEEAAEFYKQHENSDYFEELIEFMSSGPCMTLVISKGTTGEGVIEEVRDYLGPKEVEKAKEDAPESLRAIYGTNGSQNALHASDSQDTAARELAFFFPNYNVPTVQENVIQRTLALIRPAVMQQHRDAILSKIEESGFQIALSKEITLTKEQAADFYKDHSDKDFFDSLCTHMSSGPILALCLARVDAISRWREILGPTELEKAKEESPESLRAQFVDEEVQFNQLHGAATEEEAEKELEFFFPKEQTLAVIKPNALNEKDTIIQKIEESGFKVSISKEQQLTKEMAAQLYSEHQNSEFFDDLTNFMTSGPSLVMVLTREDAVVGWRALMGPTDPEEAKQVQPDSLRALYGEDKLKNAVHGSSNKEHVSKVLPMVFSEEELSSVLPTENDEETTQPNE